MTNRDDWTVPTSAPGDGPLVGDDRPMLEAYLDWQRATLLHICGGLTATQLASRPLPSTSLSLLGLLRHLAKVERIWFRQRVAADGTPPLFAPEAGRDADFNGGGANDAPDAVERWRIEVDAARAAVAELPWDTTVDVHGETMSLRMVHVHMIGEYARHNGHADLLREAIDGVTGR